MDAIDTFSNANGFDLSIRDSSLGDFNSINASAILDTKQRHTIQVVATVTSSFSLAAAICAMYWFIIMRRNFRRDLVLLLIAGGFWKSLWFFVFSVVTFSEGQVKTESAFCQAGGYLLQVGFEACDVAVLFMSMHMYYQIFPPGRSKLGHDGLYRIRNWIYGVWILFPNLSASLAFVNPREAYLAQGAFCSMPLRPFWYRLGLFWIPRYMIWIYIVFVAVRIYRHVGSEFKVFGREKASESSLDMSGQSSTDGAAKLFQQRKQERSGSTQYSPAESQSREKGVSPQDALSNPSRSDRTRSPKGLQYTLNTSLPANTSRRYSAPNCGVELHYSGIETGQTTRASQSAPSSRRGSHQVAPVESLLAPETAYRDQRHDSVPSVFTRKPSVAHSTEPVLAPIHEGSGLPSESPPRTRSEANTAITQHRRAIQRQLRLLFIYPVVYMMLWVVPFVVNIMNYTTYYAQHPIYVLQIMQVFMLTAMTHVDVVVFCWRERPWRHIPGSDGTFLGSFKWWVYCFDDTWVQGRRGSRALSAVPEDETAELEKPAPQSASQPRFWASLSSLTFKRSYSPGRSQVSSAASAPSRLGTRHLRARSGGSDRKVLEVERAHERLALERADYEQNRQSLQEARISVISSQSPAAPERKEWFDQVLENEAFLTDNSVAEEKR